MPRLTFEGAASEKTIMSKGRDRPGKETRKPKAEKNKKKAGAATPPAGGAAKPALAVGTSGKK
ncbi:hypothetical protein [Bauldia litoralis]|uniref:hypothetical protein n=1 Tax=Bauldia litoralis TaxID=665467 RepID=UPI003297187B